ncbi:hypothetical protein [Roseobacter sp. HKCCA0882]|uniref:hypothetical protein n=1 Tax=Roseobacter sp. HKCCA0882 TaxID=3120337 RepID=UPI0030EBC270
MKFSDYMLLYRLCRERKSLGRALHLLFLRSRALSLSGSGIDFGAKNASASYYRFIKLDNRLMSYTDLHGDGVNVVQLDFEKDFDFGQKFDFALVMNTLEHVYNHATFTQSICASLVPGGRLEGFVPFLHYYHADPDDYFRYTHSCLKRILSEAGFDDIEITPICVGGLSVSAAILSRILKFPALIYCCWVLALFGDAILSKLWRYNTNIYWGLAFSGSKIR